jgi:glycosyltransferase involved in cell wall biosynthesis
MSTERSSAVRRLLVITYHFPPDGSVGGQRWGGLSKYLARLGWEVHIVTAAAQGGKLDAPGVHRHVRQRRRTLDDIYKAGARRFRKSPDVQPASLAGGPGSLPRFSAFGPLAAVRRVVSSSMFLPDHARGWVGRAASAARGLLRERKFDVVITSGPPHSVYFAGLLATQGGDAKFWIDMRDPWSMTHQMHLAEDWLIRGERSFLRRLEHFVLKRAGRVLVNTQEFASVLKADEPDLDVLWFPNGIDLEQLPTREESSVEKYSISHVGTLYAKRNLSSVFGAMRALLRDRPEAAAMLRLNIAGPLESPHRERMHEEIAAAGLTSMVNILGVIPHAKALELLARSHIALVLAQDQPMCVPAKVYESVGLAVPTLVIAEDGSAAAREARRIGAMTLDGGDVDGMRSLMEELLAGRIPTSIKPRTPISYEDLATKMDRLLRDAITQ